MKKFKPSDLEMQILSVLWDRGPSTAREVMETMPDGKERAYTSVLSVMQVMEKKGFLKHKNRGLAHVYSPAVDKGRVIEPFLRRVVNEVFGGRPAAMMQALLTGTQVSESELAEIRRVLDAAGDPKGSGSGKGDPK
jgi:BlaI family penicillinase repressor